MKAASNPLIWSAGVQRCVREIDIEDKDGGHIGGWIGVEIGTLISSSGGPRFLARFHEPDNYCHQ